MNKIVVIVGGTSGIGKALANLFAKKGNRVVCLGRSADEKQGELVCDVTSEESVANAFSVIKEKFGKIDILVNAAGYAVNGVSELIPVEEAKKQFDVNYFGLLSASQKALLLMDKGAKIINISSACAIFPLPFRAHYCASKAAVNMLSYGMRMELKSSGIDVVSICPGDVQTNFVKTRVKNTETNKKYGDHAQNFFDNIDVHNHKRMPVDYVAQKIYRVSVKKRTKPCVIIGRKYHAFAFFNKIFPLGWVLSFLNKIMGGQKKS